MKTALVAFKGTHAARIATYISGQNVYYVGSSQRLIESFVSSEQLNPYDRIIGLGLYTHQAKSVLVETSCTSKEGRSINLDTTLADNVFFMFSSTIGGGWCNMLTFELKRYYPQKAVAFLHISSKLNVQMVAAALQKKVALD